MWLLVFIFVATTIFLGWILFGYFIFMFCVRIFKKSELPQLPEKYPGVSVIVPCFNEESNILSKINNLDLLDYPKGKMEIVFVDGGSSDNTVKIINSGIKGKPHFKLLVSPKCGKINQINFALSKVRYGIVVNTDADSRLENDALKWISAEFEANSDVGVVGAYCRPESTLEVEKYYWSAQNRGRFIESDANSSSIAIAQCYGFRKSLVAEFPEDVIADDIYVSFFSNTHGLRTIYSHKASAIETRSPKSYFEFMSHKFRKSNAFLKESLRFLYLLPSMNPFFKVTFLTRLSQQILLPWTFLSWILVSGVLLTLFRYDIVVFGAIFLFALFVITSRIFSMVKLPDGPHKYSLLTVMYGYILTNFIMISTALSYPFYRQNSSYSRLCSSEPRNNK